MNPQDMIVQAKRTFPQLSWAERPGGGITAQLYRDNVAIVPDANGQGFQVYWPDREGLESGETRSVILMGFGTSLEQALDLLQERLTEIRDAFNKALG